MGKVGQKFREGVRPALLQGWPNFFTRGTNSRLPGH